MRVQWMKAALNDRSRIARHIADDGSPQAARKLDAEFVAKAQTATSGMIRHKVGRVRGTHEIIVKANYVIVYRTTKTKIIVLRVLHARQQVPE